MGSICETFQVNFLCKENNNEVGAAQYSGFYLLYNNPNFSIKRKNFKSIKRMQCVYLNNIVDLDYRNVKRRITINTGFKDFESVQRNLQD